MICNSMKEKEMREMRPAYRPEFMKPMLYTRPFYDNLWTPLFDEFFNPRIWERPESTLPAMNILERENAYTVQIAVPGLTKEDIKINLNQEDELVIRTDKRCPHHEPNKEDEPSKCHRRPHFLRHEFSFTHFNESLSLPDDADKDKISAIVKNGILSIEIQKKCAGDLAIQSRIIEIQ